MTARYQLVAALLALAVVESSAGGCMRPDGGAQVGDNRNVAGTASEPAVWIPPTGKPYGEITEKPEPIPAIPLGEAIRVPPGRAAVTLWVRIPAPDLDYPGRQAQYLDFPAFRRVVVIVSGESLAVPVQTAISLNGGSSGAATILVTAGRNQIISAEAQGPDGVVLARVKGVVTSVAGQVVNAAVNFGTTPVAEVLGKLDAAIGPLVPAAAVAGVVDPVVAASEQSGKVVYAKHPLSIDADAIAGAIGALVAGGKAAGSIAAADIQTQLGSTQLALSSGSVNVRLADPSGAPVLFPTAVDWPYGAVDKTGDGLPDGTVRRQACPYTSDANWLTPRIGSLFLTDPLTTYKLNVVGQGSDSVAVFSQAPPTTISAAWDQPQNAGSNDWLFYPYVSVSTRPWLVPGTCKAVKVVSGGPIAFAEIVLRDLSVAVALPDPGGSFSVPYWEWRRFDTKANVIYTLAHSSTGAFNTARNSQCEKATYFAIFSAASGALIYSASTASGSYDFASGATDSLYVYTNYTKADVTVTTQTIAQGQSVVNTGMEFLR